MVRSVEPLRVQALGQSQVLLGATEIRFRRTKALALLVYLAVLRRAHPRDALAALLTDAATDEVAKSRFRAVLTDLHREVGEYLVVGRQTVAVAQDRPIWLDLAELEAAVEEEATPAAPARLAKAVSLYQGDFLAGLSVTHAPAFEAWLLAQREHAQTLLVRALARLSEEAERVGDAPTAMQWARRVLEHVPWEEAAHRRVIRLLARAGEREAALAQYVTCRRVLATELGTAPQPETIALVEELRAGPAAPPSNLPVPSPGFIGREAELALLAERLADPACRLLTIRGLGGCGKSSLALQAAARLARPALPLRVHRFADGVYLVDLAGVVAPLGRDDEAAVTAARRLAIAIGGVEGLEFRGADPVAHLAGWLGARAVLLLLDNMEHLLAGAALLSLLVQRCAGLTLLVTSRAALGVPEERVLDLHGLALPAHPHEVEEADASRLFVQQLRQAGRRAPPAAADRAEIVRICRLTQGLPLALLLAARWAPVLSLAAIAQQLEAGLDLLAPAGGLLLPERQRSMRVILQATWGRLNALERRALRRLAVFQPGFTREAAQAVAGAEPATLLRLGEGALVERDPTSERYRVQELVRQYAAEQLARHPAEEGDTRARHAAFYAALVQAATPALRRTVEAQKVISADSANIRLAWDWAVEWAEAALLEQLLEGFARWHELQGLPVQAAEALEQAATRLRAAPAQAAMPDPSLQRLLGRVLVEEALALSWQGAHDPAVSLFEEAQVLARVTASLPLEGRVAYGRGWQLVRQRDLPAARPWLQRALALARVTQQADLEADVLLHLGMLAVHAGAFAQARGYLDQALTFYRAQAHQLGAVLVAYCLGLLAHARGEFDEARRLLEDVLRRSRALAWRLMEHSALHGLGEVADEGWGRHVVAEDHFAQALRLTQQTGDRTRGGFALAALGRNALYQGDLERAGAFLDQALSLSREVTSQESAAMALRGQSPLAHYLGDDQRARRCAEEALAIDQRVGLRRKERLALRLLGHALLGLGELPAAVVAYQGVADLDQTLGFAHLGAEAATDLARVALARGDTAQAMERVASILPDLERGTLADLEEPALAYLTCYRVLRAASDARADGALAAGHAFLEERAAQFGDEERRSWFLSNLPAHRDLLAAWLARGGWAAGDGKAAASTGDATRLFDIG
jgi:predicted ATPase/DNA-binding SARP family transcriptional activator